MSQLYNTFLVNVAINGSDVFVVAIFIVVVFVVGDVVVIVVYVMYVMNIEFVKFLVYESVYDCVI